MKTIFKAIAALSLLLGAQGWLLGAGQDEPAALKGTVAADKLNVRVKPGLGRTVVAILSQGEQIEARSVKGDWVEIAAPKSAAVWVAESNLAGDSLKKGAALRAGPGVAYDAFGFADSSESVKVIDASQEGWRRIEPPKGLFAYAAAKHINFEPEGFAKLRTASEDKDAPAVEKPSLMPELFAETDAKAGDLDRNVMMEGILLPVRDSKHMATHALAAQVNGEYHTLCYLKGANYNLQLWERRKVRIKGVQSWVGDWRRPLVEIELITPVWQ